MKTNSTKIKSAKAHWCPFSNLTRFFMALGLGCLSQLSALAAGQNVEPYIPLPSVIPKVHLSMSLENFVQIRPKAKGSSFDSSKSTSDRVNNPNASLIETFGEKSLFDMGIYHFEDNSLSAIILFTALKPSTGRKRNEFIKGMLKSYGTPDAITVMLQDGGVAEYPSPALIWYRNKTILMACFTLQPISGGTYLYGFEAIRTDTQKHMPFYAVPLLKRDEKCKIIASATALISQFSRSPKQNCLGKQKQLIPAHMPEVINNISMSMPLAKFVKSRPDAKRDGASKSGGGALSQANSDGGFLEYFKKSTLFDSANYHFNKSSLSVIKITGQQKGADGKKKNNFITEMLKLYGKPDKIVVTLKPIGLGKLYIAPGLIWYRDNVVIIADYTINANKANKYFYEFKAFDMNTSTPEEFYIEPALSNTEKSKVIASANTLISKLSDVFRTHK